MSTVHYTYKRIPFSQSCWTFTSQHSTAQHREAERRGRGGSLATCVCDALAERVHSACSESGCELDAIDGGHAARWTLLVATKKSADGESV